MADYILKKEKEKRVERMDLKENAEQTKREIADLKASQENAEGKLAALTDKHEKNQVELSKIGLGHYLEQRELEPESRTRSVIVGQSVAKPERRRCHLARVMLLQLATSKRPAVAFKFHRDRSTG